MFTSCRFPLVAICPPFATRRVVVSPGVPHVWSLRCAPSRGAGARLLLSPVLRAPFSARPSLCSALFDGRGLAGLHPLPGAASCAAESPSAPGASARSFSHTWSVPLAPRTSIPAELPVALAGVSCGAVAPHLRPVPWSCCTWGFRCFCKWCFETSGSLRCCLEVQVTLGAEPAASSPAVPGVHSCVLGSRACAETCSLWEVVARLPPVAPSLPLGCAGRRRGQPWLVLP